MQYTDAGADAVAELATLLERARIEYATWRDAYRRSGGAGGKQADIAQLEAAATHIAGFQLAVIHGLLQTPAPAYARELLTLPCGPLSYAASESDIDSLIAERIRRQEVLYRPGKQIQLVMGEAALHTNVGSLTTPLLPVSAEPHSPAGEGACG